MPHDYTRDILPHLPQALREQWAAFPHVRLSAGEGFVPLARLSPVMLVGLTGTGKSTLVRELMARADDAQPMLTDHIPTRRQLTDLIVIPSAQHALGEPLAPVTDRAERFRLSRAYRQHVASGGTAAAFAQLSVRVPSGGVLLSEGIRGAVELTWAFAHTSWRVVELTVPPLERLKRLTGRDDPFDRIDTGALDWSFLPEALHDTAREMLQRGEISANAIAIARAESANYRDSLQVTPPSGRYLVLDTATTSPAALAEQVAAFIAAP